MNLEESLELPVILRQIEELAVTSLGKERIQHTEVSYDPLRIKQNNRSAKEALQCVVQYGALPLDGLRDIRDSLLSCKKGMTLTAYELLEEIRCIDAIKEVLHYRESLKDTDCPELKDLIGTLAVHEKEERYLKERTNAYGEVKDEASPKLFSLRKQLQTIDSEIHETAVRFMNEHSSSVVDRISATRNGRTVVLVKASEKNAFGGYVYGDSQSGLASYIEPKSLILMNNKKSALVEEEREEVNRILSECSKVIQPIAEEEINNIETCGILDEIFAKAVWGFQREGCVANLNNNHSIELRKARHPLIAKEKVVANDYHLSGEKRVLLITGPNTGGKTVSLKIIGLFTIMTYCGIPVLASSADIPLLEGIDADIGDDQSVISSFSSFSYHITKQAEALKHANENTLVLLDEVGSGTDPKEGESLAIAVLNELRNRKALVVASTHYSRLKTYGKRHDDILVASVSFDMETLSPTYHYVEGITGNSNALEVAARCGLNEQVIKYATFLKNQSKSEEEKTLETLDAELQQAKAKNERLEKKLREISAYQKELEQEKLALRKEKEEWEANADTMTEEIKEEARIEAKRILKEMRSMQQNAKYHEVLAKKRELETPIETEREEEPSATYRVNDTVELKVNGALAKVKEVRKKELLLSVNGREMRVKKTAVRPTLKVLNDTLQQTEVHVSHASSFESFPIECNLIGMHVDEARETLTSYLDQAKIHHLSMCRIIHGNGSGALRAMVNEVLKKDSDVVSYGSAMAQNGGSGATVVKLNHE